MLRKKICAKIRTILDEDRYKFACWFSIKLEASELIDEKDMTIPPPIHKKLNNKIYRHASRQVWWLMLKDDVLLSILRRIDYRNV